VDMYEASITKVLFDDIGYVNSIDLLKDKVSRQMPVDEDQMHYEPTLYDEPITMRLVYTKREGVIL
jgi:predicted small secreted protein